MDERIEPSWEMQQVNEEREKAAVEALNRCLEAGADRLDIETLARECGVDIRFITKE